MNKVIVVAGATGNIGERIVKFLVKNNVEVRAVVRSSASSAKLDFLKSLGANIYKIENWNEAELAKACVGASCVVSALAGLREVVIDAQTVLLKAAVTAGVPRFIPSDYSLDFTSLLPGENRNLEWRKEFHAILDNTPIKATTVFNGAFMELLTGDMPMILFSRKRILHWGNKDQLMDFTTMDNTAEYTALAAIDSDTPRFLRIAGDQISASSLSVSLTVLIGDDFKLLRPGGLGLLNFMTKVARFVSPAKNELYPAWQGMQYMNNMASGKGKLHKLDNDRYPGIKWTSVSELVGEYLLANEVPDQAVVPVQK